MTVDEPVKIALRAMREKVSAINMLRDWISAGAGRSVSISQNDGSGFLVGLHSDDEHVYDSKDYHFCSLEQLIKFAVDESRKEKG